MPRPKKVEAIDVQDIEVIMDQIPYVGIRFRNPQLSGTVAVGETIESALASARAEYRRRFPANGYRVKETFRATAED